MKKFISRIEPFLYLTPTLAGLLLFSAGAVVTSFLMSFTRWEIVSPPEWIGLGNYATILQSDLFWKVFGNTFYYTLLSVPLSIVLSLALALLVHEKVRGITFFRATYFLPVVSSTVAVAIVWSWLYHPEVGLINLFLRKAFGVDGPRWLSDTDWAMPAMVFMSVWKGLGYNMVIFLAGLQNISEEYYEAARIDGAPAWRRFVNVTLPMLSPTTFFVLIINLIGSFQVFEQTYILTKGGPANATLTLSYYIYQNAFQFFKMGYAASMAYVLFAVILVVTLFQFRLQRRWVFYG